MFKDNAVQRGPLSRGRVSSETRKSPKLCFVLRLGETGLRASLNGIAFKGKAGEHPSGSLNSPMQENHTASTRIAAGRCLSTLLATEPSQSDLPPTFDRGSL